MALSEEQKTNIRLYLGYSDQFRDTNTTLESQLLPGSLSATAETLVVSMLDSIADIDEKYHGAHDRQRALKAGEIALTGVGTMNSQRLEGRRFVHRLARVIVVVILDLIFAGEPAMSHLNPLGRGPLNICLSTSS